MAKEWTIRSGEQVLVRPASGGPEDWRWETMKKVMYFSESEVFAEPWNRFAPRTFRQGDKLYAVHDDAVWQVRDA